MRLFPHRKQEDGTNGTAADQHPGDTPRKHRHPVLRAIAWIAGSVVLLIVLLLVALGIYSTTSGFQQRLRTELISTLETATGGRVDLQGIQFHLMSLSLEADGLVIHGLEGPGQAPYLSADRVLVRITLKNIFAHATNSKGAMKFITLALLHVDDPHVHLIINKDGTTNQPEPKHPSTSNEPVMDTLLDLQASKVELVNGIALVNDKAIPFDLDAENLAANVRYILSTDRYGLTLSIDNIRSRMKDANVAHSHLWLAAQLGRKMVDLQQLNFDTGTNSHLWARARVDNFDHPIWGVSVRGNVQLPQISTLAGFPGLDAGTIDLNLDGHSCQIAPQQAQKRQHFWQRRHPQSNPANTKALPPSPDCEKGYLVAGDFKLHDAGYRDQNVNVKGVNGGAKLRVTPTELLFDALTANLPGGGAIEGDLRIHNWLGEVPPAAPATSPTIQAGQKTVNATAKTANAKPPATGAPVITPVEPAHAYLDVRVSGISLRTINAITEPAKYTDLGLDTVVNGPVHVEWGGTAKDLPSSVVATADLHLSPTGERLHGYLQSVPVSGVLKGTYRGSDETVHIEQADLHTPASSVVASGTLGVANGDPLTRLNLNANFRDLSEFDSIINAIGYKSNGKTGSAALPVALHGDAHFQGTASGPIAGLDIKGHLQANGLAVHLGSKGDIAIDSVVADAEYAPQGITVATASIRRNTAVLIVSGAVKPHRIVKRHVVSYAFDNDTQINGKVQLATAQVHDLLDIAGQGSMNVTGTISANATVSGMLGNLNGDGSVNLQNGEAYNQPYNSILVGLSVRGQQINAQSIQINAQGMQANGNAAYNLASKHFNAHLAANDVRLANLTTIKQKGTPVDGLLSFRADANGTAEQPGLNIHLQLANATYTGKAVGQLTADVTSTGNTVYLRAHTDLLATRLDVNGQVQLVGNYPMQAHATFTNLDVAPVLKLVGSSVDATSSAAGHLDVSGDAKTPATLRANLLVSALSVTTQGLTFAAQAPLHASLNGGVATLDPVHVTGPDTDLNLTASAQVFSPDGKPLPATGGHVTAQANGTVNVGIAHRFDPQIVSSGKISLDVTANGTTRKPNLGGTVTFQNTNLAYSQIPNGLSNMNGSASFTEDRLQLNNITAYSGGGRIVLTGFVQYHNGLFADVTATATAVRVRYYGVSATMNAAIHLQGSGNGGAITGNVMVTRFGLAQTFDFGSIAGGAGNVSPPPNPDSLLNKITLNVRLQSSPALSFQNSYARIAGTVDLTARGTLAVPSILGRITINDGDATFNGTRYELERGQVYFNNPIRIDPIVDLDATAHIENYDVTIGVHGSAKNLKLTYRSEPPLSQADIFNLLALGRTQEEAQINSQQLQQQGEDPTTNALLGGALNATVSNRVNKLFGGTGQVKIDPAFVGALGTSSARITVTEQLSRQITVTFATNVNSEAEQLIQLQYQIDPNKSVQITRDENGVFSIVYRIRKRYK